MPNSQRSIWITFNGEIFNYLELAEELVEKGHRFPRVRTRKSFCICIKRKAKKVRERLNGQWAFAIWDRDQRKLFLSRDRLGVRPLFYTKTEDKFLFASEIKGLLACPEVRREIDPQALDQTFTFWATLPPRTAFKNILQLPARHSMVVKDGRVAVWPYWNIEYAPDRERSQLPERHSSTSCSR